jgi:hypothetical protein
MYRPCGEAGRRLVGGVPRIKETNGRQAQAGRSCLAEPILYVDRLQRDEDARAGVEALAKREQQHFERG